jgi:hypothetical protein
MRAFVCCLLVAAATALHADEMTCATSEANDARVRALHERVAARPRLMENAAAPKPAVREGAFYLGVDDRIAPGHRPFDLEGQSLIFEPRGSGYAVRRDPLHWSEPAEPMLRDFQSALDPPWWYVRYDVPGAPVQILGQSVSTLYLSAFNGITLTPPKEPASNQFDDLEAAVYREPLISPLMITNRKPARLLYPQVFAERRGSSVVITWRSTGGAAFGYDVQAELRGDGSYVFSYRTMRDMRWGTPILTAGFDPASATRRSLGYIDDAKSDLVSGTYTPSLADVNDLRRVEVFRVGESDLLAVRLTLGAALNASALPEGQVLRYVVQIGASQAWLDVDRNGYAFTPFNAPRSVANGPEVRFDGSSIELFGVQTPPDLAALYGVRAWSVSAATGRTIDFAQISMNFDVPVRRIATDLSTIASVQLALPIAEPFTLGDFDPYEVWNRLQSSYYLSSYDVDAVAMYQTFYTDLIFFAGAYATGGNPGVDGIAPASPTRSSTASRGPTLLHMNQLTYGWNATEKNASNVILHEFGHRWLYFFRIQEDGVATRSLNPTSSHPAGFVSTPAAFKVWEDGESSVMGGATFALQNDGRFKAHATNYGYSWTDLYLMGLAAPTEVPQWYYLANTDPALPKEYWPAEGAVVTAERRNVSLDQVVAVEGTRNPSVALSQRLFRVMFVLVTDGGEPTAEQVAKMNEWRALFEKNFSLATGGRARVATDYVAVPKKRAVR